MGGGLEVSSSRPNIPLNVEQPVSTVAIATDTATTPAGLRVPLLKIETILHSLHAGGASDPAVIIGPPPSHTIYCRQCALVHEASERCRREAKSANFPERHQNISSSIWSNARSSAPSRRDLKPWPSEPFSNIPTRACGPRPRP